MTITVDQLKSVRTVYSHANCPDGTSSAMIVNAAFASVGLAPTIQFIQYDNAEHANLVPEPHQMFVDITPPMSRWEEWRGFSPIVLDHHDTAKPATEGLGGVYGGLDDSGASLAFKHVLRQLLPESRTDRKEVLEKWAKFAFLCMLRDTWKEEHEEWRTAAAVAQALNFYSTKALLASAGQVDLDVDEMIRFGGVLYRKVEWKAQQYAKGSVFDVHDGKKFGYFNCTEKTISEAAHELLNSHGCDVAVAFFFKTEGGRADIVVSLRSHKGGVVVNKMAETMGGGGHPPAAGFRIKEAFGTSLSDIIDTVRKAYDVAAAAALEPKSDPAP